MTLACLHLSTLDVFAWFLRRESIKSLRVFAINKGVSSDLRAIAASIPCMQNSGVLMEFAVDAVECSADTGGPLDW